MNCEFLLNKNTIKPSPFFRYTPIENFDAVEAQRRMERFAIDHQGYVATYSETQLTREEFEEMFSFNLRVYEKLRKEMKCEKAFPHVYEKISKPLALKGIRPAM